MSMPASSVTSEDRAADGAAMGCIVPVRLESRVRPGQSSRCAAAIGRPVTSPTPATIRYLRTARRRPARLGRGRQRAGAGQGRELADPPRVRLGEPGLAPLDPLLRRSLPLRPLRRARLRHDRLGRRRPLRRRAGSTISRRWSTRPRPTRRSRSSASRRAPPPASTTRCAIRSASRASCSTAATRAAPPGAATPTREREYRGHHRARAARLGHGQSRVPAGLHLALHPRRHATSSSAGSTSSAGRRPRRRSRPSCCESRAQRRRRRRCCRRCARRRSCSTRARTTSCRSRRAACSPRGIPGAQFVELDSTQPRPARERAGLGRASSEAVLELRRPRDARARRGRRLRRALRRASARSSRCSREGLGNAEIAERLAISEKTVRNHVSKLFDKLGVWTRAQAIVFARDHGFHA